VPRKLGIWPIPHSEKPRGPNGLMQFSLAVYLLASKIPKYFVEADLKASQPCPTHFERNQTGPSF